MKRNRFKTKKKRWCLKEILIIIILILSIMFLFFNNLFNFIFDNNIYNSKKNITKRFDLTKFMTGIDYEVKTPKVVDVSNIKEDNGVPLIYIYNTHQTEEYLKNEDYNFSFNVYHASLILQSKLKSLGYNAYVEKNNIKDILNAYNWNYKNSYKASKMLAQDFLNKNESVKYVIDLHRDSIPKNLSYAFFNDKSYAKIMIVLGKGHDNFSKNLEFANKVNTYLKEENPVISRGIDIKEKSGIYNQDICNNALLIEVGSEYNDLESVSNSLDVLARVYKRILNEEKE